MVSDTNHHLLQKLRFRDLHFSESILIDFHDFHSVELKGVGFSLPSLSSLDLTCLLVQS